jgi:hypothetical protein
MTPEEGAAMTYETPTVRDYGDLLELTAATGSGSTEDGTNKFHATFGSQPARRSDERLKTRIAPVPTALEGLKKLESLQSSK